MEGEFQGGCVIREDHCVNVEAKGYCRAAKFLNAVLRVESARHPNFENSLPEKSDIRNHVDMPHFRNLCHRNRMVLLGLRLRYLLFEILDVH